jgi:helix-turn-helix resolvase-like protein
MSAEKTAVARQMYDTRQHTVAAIAATLGVSRATIYRSLGSDANGEAGGGSAGGPSNVRQNPDNVG